MSQEYFFLREDTLISSFNDLSPLAAGSMIYADTSDHLATTPSTSFGRGLLALTNEAELSALLDLSAMPIGSLNALSLLDDAADSLLAYDVSAAEWKSVLGKNLGFTAAGSATLRSLQGKLRNFTDVTDYGADPTGVASSAAAFAAAIAAMPAAGATLYVPAGTYLNPAIAMTKTMRIVCDGRDSVVFKSTSASAAVIDIQNSNSEISEFTINHTVVRTTGNPSIKITAGDNSSIYDFRINSASTGILISSGAGFAYLDRGYIYGLLPVYGVGVKTTNGSGLYASNLIIAGKDLDTANQPLSGLDLSDCGNAVINSVQCLVTGTGFLASPAGAGVATSIDVLGSYFDHCTIGVDLSPTGGANASTFKFTSCWSAASTSFGWRIKPLTGAVAQDISIVNCTLQSNGTAGVDPCLQIGGDAAGIVTGVKVLGCSIYDNAIDGVVVGTNAFHVSIIGNKLGDGSFPNDHTLTVSGNCTHVILAENDFEDGPQATFVSFTSTGVGHVIADNTGYEPVFTLATFGADQNNLVTNGVKRATFLVGGSAARVITGLAGGVAGMERTFINNNSFNLTFQTGSGSSSAANQFNMTSHAVLAPGGAIHFVYDGSLGFWKTLAQPQSVALSALSALSSTGDLLALEALATTGLTSRTASDTWATRTLTAPAAGFTITNPAGIAGDPTFVLSNDLAAIEGLSGTGLIRRTTTDTFSAGTTVSAAEGGTGLTTYAIGDLIYASATTPTLAKLAAVASGSILASAGVNTAPAWTATPSVTSLTAANSGSGSGATPGDFTTTINASSVTPGFKITGNFTAGSGSGSINSAMTMAFTDSASVQALTNQIFTLNFTANNSAGGSTAYDSAFNINATISQTMGSYFGATISGPSVASGKTLTTYRALYFTAPGGLGTITSRHIFFSDAGAGDVKIGNTTASTTSSSGALVIGGGAGIGGQLSVGGVLRIDQTPAAVGTGLKTINAAADSTTNFGHYLSLNMNGTTYYIPCSATAPT